MWLIEGFNLLPDFLALICVIKLQKEVPLEVECHPLVLEMSIVDPPLEKSVQMLRKKQAVRETNYVYDVSNTLTTGHVPRHSHLIFPLQDSFRNPIRGDFLELYTVTGETELIPGTPNDQIFIKGMRTDRGIKAMPDYLREATAQYERIRDNLNVVGILNDPIVDGYYVVKRVPNNINYSMWATVKSLDELDETVRDVLLQIRGFF